MKIEILDKMRKKTIAIIYIFGWISKFRLRCKKKPITKE